MHLSKKTKKCLAILIQTLAEAEQKLEMVRQILAEQRLFEPNSTFKRIDQDRTGELTIRNLRDFMLDNKINASDAQLLYLHNRMDINKDGRINYPDYLMFILTQEDERLKKMASLRTSYNILKNTLLPYEVEWALGRIFDQLITNHRNITVAQKDLFECHDFTSLDALKCIDTHQQGFITPTDLCNFIKDQKLFLSTQELESFFTTIDRDQTGQISYAELMNALSPIQQQTHHSSEQEMRYQQGQERLQQMRRGRESIDDSMEQRKRKDQEETQSRIYQTPKRRNYGDTSSADQVTTPMKGKEEQHLALALNQLICINNELEDLKKQLALKQDFHPSSAFRIMDKCDRDQINKLDFELACNGTSNHNMIDLSIYPSKDQVYLFFQSFVPFSSFMTYKHFLSAMLPSSEEYRLMMLSRGTDHQLSPATRSIFVRLMNHHFSAQSQVEELKQKLSKRPLFNKAQAFYALDRHDQGYITIEHFHSLFQEHNINVSSNDLEGLVKIFDMDYDGRVSFAEFIHQISPKRDTR